MLQNANVRDGALTYTIYTKKNQEAMTANAVKEGLPSKAAKGQSVTCARTSSLRKYPKARSDVLVSAM